MQTNTFTLTTERSESPLGGRTNMEQEKRIRREIANSNERRRMQSINAGFQSLRTLLPHHEGEKLSKAAILQQTAEYIYQLEQEKTRLLSQNCQLKRLLNQQEGESGTQGSNVAGKKRKPDLTVTELAAAEVENEAAGVLDIRHQLDRERRLRMTLQEQLRQLEAELYPDRLREITHKLKIQYHQDDEEVVGVAREETAAAVASLGGTLQPVTLQPVAALQPVAHTETVIATSASPPASPRLPTVLEAAIKAEPKVEVERLASPPPASPTASPPTESGDRLSRVYLASTSRQNLETIVEAIRHLEGDNLFTESAAVTTAPEGPLALTPPRPPSDKHLLKFKMNQYLQFHRSPPPSPDPTPPPANRPGVIVVKHT